MKKTEMMKRYEAETDEIATWHWHDKEFVTDDYIAWLEKIAKSTELKECPSCGAEVIPNPYCHDLEQKIELLEMQLEETQAKATAYDRVIEKLSLWGKHLKSSSMAQNSLDFIYCAQQVMEEITLTLPDGWEATK